MGDGVPHRSTGATLEFSRTSKSIISWSFVSWSFFYNLAYKFHEKAKHFSSNQVPKGDQETVLKHLRPQNSLLDKLGGMPSFVPQIFSAIYPASFESQAMNINRAIDSTFLWLQTSFN